jgi:hypothetical protein
MSLDARFGSHRKVIAPWPRGGRSRLGPTYDRVAVERLLDEPADLMEVDPGALHASQNWIVRSHVAYYLTGEWERTGRTSADRDSELNRFSVIALDNRGQSIILAGHHRAAAALIEGRPLLVRTLCVSTRTAVTPLLFVDPTTPSPAPDTALQSIMQGGRATVATVDVAGTVLVGFGLTAAEIVRALSPAGPR